MFLRMVSVMKPSAAAGWLGAAGHDDVDKVVGKDEAAGRGVGGDLRRDGPLAGRQDRRHEALALADQLGAAQRLAGIHGDPGDEPFSFSSASGSAARVMKFALTPSAGQACQLMLFVERLAHRHVAGEHQHVRAARSRAPAGRNRR